MSLTNIVRQLDLFSLRLFLSAVEEGQVTGAARREHIAASTATRRLQMLEELVGTPLLVRTREGVHPTEAGELLEAYAREVLSGLDSLHASFAQLAARMEGELIVASAHSAIVDLLAPAISAFVARWPSVRLTLQELDNSEVRQRIVAGAVDVGVFATIGDLDADDLTLEDLRREPLVAVLPTAHPLAARSAVRFDDLIAHDLVLTRTTDLAVDELARRRGATVGPRQVVRTGEVALGMVRAGLGITIVSRQLVDRADDPAIAVRGIPEPWAVRRIHAAVRRERAGSPATRAFVRCLVAAAETRDGAILLSER
ncbi:LysR family transcriptional regulator [Microbacterium sp. No. 7]|uniref:LysR family transcriptional regulator n=1 Tax=Microbacterium sp. No. 7 TaxID=1714373 RepID=UPI0018D02F55|nr:LysR family transcriptional regulator [Microbacterium sp. No. 7]